MDPTVRIGLAIFIGVFLLGMLAYLFKYADQQLQVWARQLEGLAGGFDGLQMEWETAKDVPPFQKKFPVLKGTLRGHEVRVVYGPPPNTGRGRMASHTIISVAPSKEVPSNTVIVPRAISFGKPDSGASEAFEKAFSAKADAPDELSSWLNPGRKAELIRAYSDFDYVSFTSTTGTELYVRSLLADTAAFSAALDRVVALADTLA